MILCWLAQAKGSGRRCVFKELQSVNHYTQFQSIANERWFVGFNRRGRPLRAATSTSSGRLRRRRRRRRCYLFVKTAVNAHADAVPAPPTISYERLYSVLHHRNHMTSGAGDITWRSSVHPILLFCTSGLLQNVWAVINPTQKDSLRAPSPWNVNSATPWHFWQFSFREMGREARGKGASPFFWTRALGCTVPW